MVQEPTVEDTISILRGLKEKYEIYHGIRIADSAVIASPRHFLTDILQIDFTGQGYRFDGRSLCNA